MFIHSFIPFICFNRWNWINSTIFISNLSFNVWHHLKTYQTEQTETKSCFSGVIFPVRLSHFFILVYITACERLVQSDALHRWAPLGIVWLLHSSSSSPAGLGSGQTAPPTVPGLRDHPSPGLHSGQPQQRNRLHPNTVTAPIHAHYQSSHLHGCCICKTPKNSTGEHTQCIICAFCPFCSSCWGFLSRLWVSCMKPLSLFWPTDQSWIKAVPCCWQPTVRWQWLGSGQTAKGKQVTAPHAPAWTLISLSQSVMLFIIIYTLLLIFSADLQLAALAIDTLNEAAAYFSKLHCKERLRDVHYMQARLHRSLGQTSQCNRSAMLFRLLDQELQSPAPPVSMRL